MTSFLQLFMNQTFVENLKEAFLLNFFLIIIIFNFEKNNSKFESSTKTLKIN